MSRSNLNPSGESLIFCFLLIKTPLELSVRRWEEESCVYRKPRASSETPVFLSALLEQVGHCLADLPGATFRKARQGGRWCGALRSSDPMLLGPQPWVLEAPKAARLGSQPITWAARSFCWFIQLHLSLLLTHSLSAPHLGAAGALALTYLTALLSSRTSG